MTLFQKTWELEEDGGYTVVKTRSRALGFGVEGARGGITYTSTKTLTYSGPPQSQNLERLLLFGVILVFLFLVVCLFVGLFLLDLFIGFYLFKLLFTFAFWVLQTIFTAVCYLSGLYTIMWFASQMTGGMGRLAGVVAIP